VNKTPKGKTRTAKTRATYGRGGVHFNDAKQLWVATVELGAGPDGKRHRRFISGRDRDDVLDRLAAHEHDARRGLPPPDRIRTTSEWLDTWLATVLPRTAQPSTVRCYRQITDLYVAPYVGRVALAKLQPEHVESMMAALETRGLAPRTVALARTVLRRALSIAERRGRVARNVAALTDPPAKPAAKLDDALDADDAQAVLNTAKGDRLEALAVLALGTGMRHGECLRLRWPDVDLTAGTVHVGKSKTDAGVRTIALPGFVVDALKTHRARQRAERIAAQVWGDSDLVFASPVGTMLQQRTVLNWWHRLTIAAGVGRRRFHASRHTAATLMLNNGVPLEVVSKTLGHAGLAITADVYAKVRPELQRKAADAMDELFGNR
jgi:integrase